MITAVDSFLQAFLAGRRLRFAQSEDGFVLRLNEGEAGELAVPVGPTIPVDPSDAWIGVAIRDAFRNHLEHLSPGIFDNPGERDRAIASAMALAVESCRQAISAYNRFWRSPVLAGPLMPPPARVEQGLLSLVLSAESEAAEAFGTETFDERMRGTIAISLLRKWMEAAYRFALRVRLEPKKQAKPEPVQTTLFPEATT